MLNSSKSEQKIQPNYYDASGQPVFAHFFEEFWNQLTFSLQ